MGSGEKFDGENVLNRHLPQIVRFRSNFREDWTCDARSTTKFNVKVSKVKVTAISIKFTTDNDHVTPDLSQTFKVNGSKLIRVMTY